MKTLEFEQLENDYLYSEIIRIMKEEETEKKYINEMIKNIKFIFENLDNYDFNFSFFEEENVFGKYEVIEVNLNNYNSFIIYNVYFLNYEEIELLTDKQLKILKDYQNNKFIEIETETEF